MTGYEIRNAIRHAYGFDSADHLFDTHNDTREDSRTLVARVLTMISLAMKGAL